MAIYEFENVNDDHDVIESSYPMVDAPSIGTLIQKDGVWYRRKVSDYLISAGVAGIVHQYPYTSKTLHRNLPGCKTNKRGQPIIESRAHERNVMAQHNLTRD